eukprot:SAG11_NODE_467_length_9212_cov_2.153627_9_plen_142_part_00
MSLVLRECKQLRIGQLGREVSPAAYDEFLKQQVLTYTKHRLELPVTGAWLTHTLADAVGGGGGLPPIPVPKDGVYGEKLVHNGWIYWTLPPAQAPTESQRSQDKEEHEIPPGYEMVNVHSDDWDEIIEYVGPLIPRDSTGV